ncbi:Arc family DNA-binding protein [Comamonas aquatica]|uniref:Arc family DNA-binding protein n=1 Tax=Comamonas aquatica TaxID=225991 RepID=UPI0022DD3850|nr:Arc family DNA-binding protein [Comamonas aquatica]WBM43475.1 Arc family DNA-binding protein [Comamonas aquatica]
MAEKNLYPSDQADKVLVRMPDGMRDRLKEVAKSNNRTLNAEIVARLEESFSTKASAPISAQQIELLVSSLENKVLMLSMRYDMVKLRNENLVNQIQRISVESQLLAQNAKTDADFQRSEEKISELDAIEEQAEQLHIEAEKIIRDRDAALAELNFLRDSFAARRKDLEMLIAQRAQADKKNSDH